MDAEIIDLVAVAEACRPLVAWWHEFSMSGDASPSELERARKRLATLSPTTGRLGRAIERIASAESQANTGQVLAALELIVRTAACISGPSPANAGNTATARKRKRRASDDSRQPALPGFE